MRNTAVRSDVRKVVGLDDTLSTLPKQPNRARIYPGYGRAYYNGFTDGNGGKTGGDPSTGGQPAGGGAGAGGGSNSNTGKDGTTSNASDKIDKNTDLSSMGGLFDCETGRCVNVRLNGQARAPEGWSAPCTPPDITNKPRYYYTASGNLQTFNKDAHNCFTTATIGGTYNTEGDALGALLSIFPPGDARSSIGKYGDAISLMSQKTGEESGIILTNAIQYLSKLTETGDPCGGAGGIQAFQCSSSVAFCNENPDPRQKWPPTMCSEMIFDGKKNMFSPACAQYDDNLPERLKGDSSGLILCDKDGNKVYFLRTNKGIDISQDKYKLTSSVDVNTLKVMEQIKY